MPYSTPDKARAHRSTPEFRARKAARQRERYRKNPEHHRALTRKYYRAHQEKRLAYYRTYLANPENYARRKARMQKYTLENKKRHSDRKLASLESLAGRVRPEFCEVCGRAGSIAFDHCHQRNVFRGWLCKKCNVILGFADDDPNILRQLAAYLNRTAKLVPPQLALPGI